MREKPALLWIVSFYFAAIAVGLPLQIMLLYGHSPVELGAVLAKLTPLNWVILLLAPIASVLAWRASPWLLALLPVMSFVIFQNNWMVAELSTDYPPLLAGLATLGHLLVTGAVLAPQIRELLLHPELQWWRTSPRMAAELPLVLELAGQKYYAVSFDLSEGGMFVPLSRAKAPQQHAGNVYDVLKPGARLGVLFKIGGAEAPIACHATLVRKTRASQGHYPEGMGLRFDDLPMHDRNRLRSFLKGSLETLAPSAAA